MRTALVAIALTAAAAVPAGAHTFGACVPGGPERCERWTAIFTTPAAPGMRSDQFTAGLAATGSSAYLAVDDAQFAYEDPYAGTRGRGAVVALDVRSGAERWRRAISTRAYDSLGDVAVAPDERLVFATGGAYDAWSITATDSRIVTTALDAATGAPRWQAEWDGLPDGTDNAKVVAVSPDGRRVYVGGITQAAGGELNSVVIAYDASSGRERWAKVYDGLGLGGGAVLFDLAVSPDGSRVVMTGYSAGTAAYDNDVATVAYDARSGRLAWEHRLDGSGAQKSDRASALAVDDEAVYVTGDSSPAAGSNIDVQTAAIGLRDGELRWVAREDPSGGRFDTGRAIAVAAGRVVVTAQTPSPTDGEGLDAVTTARDAASGEIVWSRRRAQPRTSELANDLQASPDAVFMIASARPVVQYTSLDEQAIEAYRLSDGASLWSTRLDAGAGNALTGTHLALTPDAGTLVGAGVRQRSANPMDPGYDVYDAVVAAFDAR